MINKDYVAQVDENDCGAACLAMILKHYNHWKNHIPHSLIIIKISYLEMSKYPINVYSVHKHTLHMFVIV